MAVSLLSRAQRVEKLATHPSARDAIASVVVQVLDVHLELRRGRALPKVRVTALRAILDAQSAGLDAIQYGPSRRGSPAEVSYPVRPHRASDLT